MALAYAKTAKPRIAEAMGSRVRTTAGAGASLRRTCTTTAPAMMMARQTAAMGLRIGATPVSGGRIRPKAPITSAMAMSLTVGIVKYRFRQKYGRRDLNPHAFRHQNLNLACIPISPLPREKTSVPATRGALVASRASARRWR